MTLRCPQLSNFNYRLNWLIGVCGVAESIDRRLFIHAADSVGVGIAGVVTMPMAKHVVIAACPTILGQHVVAGCVGKRFEDAGLMLLNKFPLDSAGVLSGVQIVHEPPSIDVAANRLINGRVRSARGARAIGVHNQLLQRFGQYDAWYDRLDARSER